MTWSPAFYRALGILVGLTLSSHWLLQVFFFVLIGCCDFSFSFTTLKALFGAISNHVATNKRKPEVYVYHDYSMEEENIYVK